MVRAGHLENKVRRQLLLNVALPLAYVICGRLGLLLAMPPGFATAVFLPRHRGDRSVRSWQCLFARDVFGFFPAQYMDQLFD